MSCIATDAWPPHTSPWGGLAFVLGSFFLMGGWRDGGVGFAFFLLKAGYVTQIACRLLELEKQQGYLPHAA
jgi:hypothetical protein